MVGQGSVLHHVAVVEAAVLIVLPHGRQFVVLRGAVKIGDPG